MQETRAADIEIISTCADCGKADETVGWDEMEDLLLCPGCSANASTNRKQVESQRIQEKATQLGCTVELVKYIERLESRVDVLLTEREQKQNLELWGA